MKPFHIKVCGITRVKDALLAAELGADMIGIIFYCGSPRYVSVSVAQKIVQHLSPTVERVGVFVNERVDRILKIVRQLRLDYVQLHGGETTKDILALKRNGVKTIKAFFISSKADYKELNSSNADLVLIDNVTTGQRGGTGQRFDWGLKPPRKIRNLILAGGISVDNVEEGLRVFDPLVVDVNSGVEVKPGVKSAEKLRLFFQKCNQLRYGIR
ncbi:MAG: N-(5'-phosphoribosyl)anthranilate isomerase [Candidatus Zixiibacteriota bacterium]